MPTALKEKPKSKEPKEEKKNSLIDLSDFKVSSLSAKKCAATAYLVDEFCQIAGINPDEFLSDKSKEGKSQQEIIADITIKISKVTGMVVRDFDFKSKQWGVLATKFFETIAYVTDCDQGLLMSDQLTMVELEEIVLELFGKFQELKVTGFFSRAVTIWQNLIELLNSIASVTELMKQTNQSTLTQDFSNGGNLNGGMTS